MKKYISPNGYKGYDISIMKYKFQVFETPDGYFSISAPMGKTEYEKKMFDNLVYYNKSIYQGKDKKQIIKNIKQYIKEYCILK